MLSYISLANAAVPAAPALADTALADTALASAVLAGPSARVRLSVGASLRSGEFTWLRSGTPLTGRHTLFADPQAKNGIALFGSGTHATGLAKFASQQRISKKYANSTKMYARPTTCIATTGGGARGPHPARDPV